MRPWLADTGPLLPCMPLSAAGIWLILKTKPSAPHFSETPQHKPISEKIIAMARSRQPHLGPDIRQTNFDEEALGLTLTRPGQNPGVASTARAAANAWNAYLFVRQRPLTTPCSHGKKKSKWAALFWPRDMTCSTPLR
ncbi:MAG: hypothetical protein R2875_15330 [Desulfobacterales bacterium]